MKVLLDACVWGGAKAELERASHDVVACGEWGEDPGDEELLRWALDQGRVLLTLDKDFGEMAIVRRIPHAGIVRLVGFPARRQGQVGCEILSRYAQELGQGAIVTVEPGRVRVRPGRERAG